MTAKELVSILSAVSVMLIRMVIFRLKRGLFGIKRKFHYFPLRLVDKTNLLGDVGISLGY